MPRVIYLIALERVFNNAIFENQVKRLLLRIKREHSQGLDLTLVVLLPWIELTRRGAYSNFRRYKSQLKSLQRELSREGIRLVTVRTLFPSAFFNMKALGLAWFSLITLPVVWYLILASRAQVIHCRYYYASFIALLAARLSPRRVKVIFDVRTLLPELGIGNGIWEVGSMAYRFWKRVERWMMDRADRVVSVSPAMSRYIELENPHARIETIPNFVDLETFRQDESLRRSKRRELGLENQTVLVYSGTLGMRHPATRLAQSVQVFFRAFGERSFFLVLTSSDEKRLEPLALELAGLGLERGKQWQAINAPPPKVPEYLNAADWSFQVFADIPVASFFSVKFAEYLSAGLPVLTHPADRATIEIIESYGVGAVLDGSLPPEKLRASLEENKAQIRERCLKTARNDFSLSRFARRYSEIYRELAD